MMRRVVHRRCSSRSWIGFGGVGAVWTRATMVAGALAIAGPTRADIPVQDDARLQPASQAKDSTGSTTSSAKTRQGSSGGLKCAVSRSDSVTALNAAASKYGLPGQYMENAAVVESRCNPNAKAGGSSAGGLGQFIDSTWSKYAPGQDKFDPSANADAMAHLTRDDVDGLTQKLGRTPTFEEAYLAHQQGLGGASCLVANPNAPATNCVSAGAITGNGGSTSMTGGQFSALVEGYYNTGSLSGAKGAVANYSATGQMPNSGNFSTGGNGSAPVTAASMPPLKTTTTLAPDLGDPAKTSSGATSYSSDLQNTQVANAALLETRSSFIGRTDTLKDSVDVNSRLRADDIQLWQSGIDGTNVWSALLAADQVQAVLQQSQAAGAMATDVQPGPVMPGLPTLPTQPSSCGVALLTGAACVPPVADSATNVAAYLGGIAIAATLGANTAPTPPSSLPDTLRPGSIPVPTAATAATIAALAAFQNASR